MLQEEEKGWWVAFLLRFSWGLHTGDQNVWSFVDMAAWWMSTAVAAGSGNLHLVESPRYSGAA